MTDPIVILILGIIIDVGGIIEFKLHPFIALLIAALVVAVFTPVAVVEQFYLAKGGIPKCTLYKKKSLIALDTVKRMKSKGIRFDYILAEGFYGQDMGFQPGLDDMGILFVFDVHKDIRIYEEAF